MVTPQQSVTEALGALKELQDGGAVAIRSEDIKRPSRERLTKAGF